MMTTKPGIEDRVENTRIEPRRRAFKGGRIVCSGSDTTYNCRIRDFSEGGARLEIDQWYSFPKNVIVEIGRLELIEARYESEIRWTKGKEIGVKFLRKLTEGENPHSGNPVAH